MTGSDLSFPRITLAAAEKGGNGEGRVSVTSRARGGGLEGVRGQSLDLLKREPGGFADSSEGMPEEGSRVTEISGLCPGGMRMPWWGVG